LFAFFLPEDGKWCHDARNLDCFSVVVVFYKINEKIQSYQSQHKYRTSEDLSVQL
jgi:hypothetical protein